MGRLGTLLQIGRAFGVRDGLLRAEYEMQRASGLMSRRMRSVRGWESWDLAHIAPKSSAEDLLNFRRQGGRPFFFADSRGLAPELKRSEEHTSELQSRRDLVCRLLLEKKKK